jgi:hypothetical protein
MKQRVKAPKESREVILGDVLKLLSRLYPKEPAKQTLYITSYLTTVDLDGIRTRLREETA